MKQWAWLGHQLKLSARGRQDEKRRAIGWSWEAPMGTDQGTRGQQVTWENEFPSKCCSLEVERMGHLSHCSID